MRKKHGVTNRWMLVTLGVLSMTVAARSTSAQLVFQVCRETCPDPLRDPVGAAQCHARIAACESKLTAYNGYMLQLGAGTPTYQLPAMYRELLQPFYSADLSGWRFAFSDHQPPDNATTDCTVTYFNRANFVLLLREGKLDGMWGWLFHELRHFTQCQQMAGTRDAYAKMWFGHLELAFLQNNDLATIHNRMIMEGDANAVSDRVMASTVVLRDAKNRLVRPIAVTLAGSSGQVLGDRITVRVGSTQRFTAKVTGGSDPLERIWRWRIPETLQLVAAPANVVDAGNGFQFTPTTTGTYYVRVRVHQPESNLVDAIRQVTVDVLPALTVPVMPRR
jgi:hypothetical protein